MAERRAEDDLRRRADGLPQLVEAAGGRYETQVLVGRVSDEISSTLLRLQPDVAVFGRHRALHHRPFGVGRVPFTAMLTGCQAVMVAPNV